MSGGFEVYGAVKSGNSEDTALKFKEMNEYVVGAVGLEKPKTLVGVVSAIVDLGRQPLPDAEYALEGEDVGKSIDELRNKYQTDITSKGIYFEEGYNGVTKQKELMKKQPRDPFQCVAIAIDFPSKIVDKGQFFGEDLSNPAPLRVWYGGKFWDGEKMVIQNLTPLKVTVIDDTKVPKDWSLNPKSVLHKMAVASELVEDTRTAFLPARIDELLGKAFLFSVQVAFEAGRGKNSDKRFYKEKITFSGALMEGQEAPVLDKTNLVMVHNPKNDLQAVREIPNHIRNTLERSKDFVGSVLEAQLKEVREGAENTDGSEQGEGDNTETVGASEETSTKPTSGNSNW